MADFTTREEAVVVFDAGGTRIAANESGHARFPQSSIGTLEALTGLLRSPGGGRIELREGEHVLAVLEGDPDRRLLDVTLDHPRTSPEAGPEAQLTLVRIEDAASERDEVVRRALGGALAHELRTPLTTIYGGAQLITDPATSEATRAEAARAVAREAQRLHNLVEDLVVLTRFDEVVESELEPVLLQRNVPSIVESERAARPEVTVELDVPPDLPPVLVHRGYVEHAFRNLLSAAIDYGPPEGRVRVTARASDDEVLVTISDEGSSLDTAEARHAFELFGRSVRTTADPSGVNLGPFVSRRLIEALGGRVWASPGGSGGMTTFALPIADDPRRTDSAFGDDGRTAPAEGRASAL